MKVTKILETRIDILDIKDIFCPNYNVRLLQILRDRYLNKCFKSVYIIEVKNIIRRSSLNCKPKALDGGVYVDITFEVCGIVYEKGEIIHGCKILRIGANGIIRAKSQYASLSIKNTSDIAIFKDNDEIPVIVNMVKYNLYDTEISVSAIPFIPILNKSIIYKILDDDSEVNKPDISIELEKNIAEHIKTNKTIFKFFKELIYPFKIISENNYSKTVSLKSENVNLIKQGDFIYKPDGYLDDDIFLVLNDKECDEIKLLYTDTVILEIHKRDLVIHLYNLYNKNLMTLLGFLETYDTKEKIKNCVSSWEFYKIFKK